MTSVRFVPRCLLCESERCGVRASLSAQDLLTSWTIGTPALTDSAAQPLLDERTICLYVCLDCGFRFFNPNLAGDADFYANLQANCPGYYALDRPENKRNARFAIEHGLRTILDVGCGTGDALDAAKKVGLKTFGVELNPSAGEVAARKGHKVFPVLLQKMDPERDGVFDLISLNQLLEHVPDPVGLIRQCARFLSPAGVIAIAVPNDEGILRFSPWLQSNWPPHHVSRWRKRDFFKLAGRVQMQAVKVGGDTLFASAISIYLSDNAQRCHALGRPYRGPSPLLLKLLANVYRFAGLKHVCRMGQSIFCYLAFDKSAK